MFVEKVDEYFSRKIKSYPVHSNRASDLGHPCVRYLVLSRTHWKERALHDVGLQRIFSLGNEIEQITLKELAASGVRVVEQQRPIEIKKYQITAHPDGKIIDVDDERLLYPMDIKSCSPHIFDAISTIEDMQRSKYLHLRKYPTQITVYMMDDDGRMQHDKGLLIFKNKVSGKLKEVWMDWDQSFADSILAKAEAVNQHIAAGTLPEPCEYDEAVCGSCPFTHICNRERVGNEVEISDNEELAGMIVRMNELADAFKEYNSLNKEIGKIVEGKEKLICGDYFIDGKWCERKGFTVEPSRYWKKSIIKL
jgi:hypothetical protein